MSENNELSSAIARLETVYIEALKNAEGKLAALNAVREVAGLPPRSPGIDASGADGGTVLTQIKRDTFYGKKQMTAIREYLTMRRAQGDGPATPREVLDALKAGGYLFETKSDDIALVTVRALMRKANNVFHRLPGGNTYGLLEWYPNAKPAKDDAHSSAPKKKRGRPRKGGFKRLAAKIKASEQQHKSETETAADD
jgi:hypothetical protein